MEYVWSTSWGVSTRLVGGLIMTHSDDNGLVCPPRLAPYQVVIVPIWRTDEEKAPGGGRCRGARQGPPRGGDPRARGRRERMKPGAKYYEWESRGASRSGWSSGRAIWRKAR